jgi:hypothetical protein
MLSADRHGETEAHSRPPRAARRGDDDANDIGFVSQFSFFALPSRDLVKIYERCLRT